MTDLISATDQKYYAVGTDTYEDDPELEPYKALFQKPLTSRKCQFSKRELQGMCMDPMHSPRLITYLINFVKAM